MIRNNQPDFIAELYYRTSEQGGRHTPVFQTGYRPQLKFAFSEMQFSGQQVFLDKEIVFPGDTVTAEITVISTEFFKGKLSIDLSFEFREGPRIIGAGKILKVLNQDLLVV
jgi:translation elongation factor EF-Tu-like GTPase